MSEKNPIKKEKQTKNKYDPKQTLARMQKDCEAKIQEYLLHLSERSSRRFQLAHWSFVVKGQSGGLFEIRFEGPTPTVLQLQYKQRRDGGRFLQKHDIGDWPKGNGKTRKRSTNKRKGNRSLLKTPRGV